MLLVSVPVRVPVRVAVRVPVRMPVRMGKRMFLKQNVHILEEFNHLPRTKRTTLRKTLARLLKAEAVLKRTLNQDKF